MSKPKKPVDCVCGGSAEYCSLVAPFGGSGIAVTCPACRLRGAAAPSEERARWEWSKMQRALKHFEAFPRWVAKAFEWELSGYDGPDYIKNAEKSTWHLEAKGGARFAVDGNAPPEDMVATILKAIEEDQDAEPILP